MEEKHKSYESASLSFREYSYYYRLSEYEWLEGYILYKRGLRRGENTRMLGVSLLTAYVNASEKTLIAITDAKREIEADLGLNIRQIDEAYPIRSLR